MPDTPPPSTTPKTGSPGALAISSLDQIQTTPSPRPPSSTAGSTGIGPSKQQSVSPLATTTLPSTSSDKSSAGGNPQQFCLRWNNYQTNLTSVFDQLLQNESFVDVTLACDGNSIKAHKMVLSACSPYFQSLFFDNPCQHPIIIMRDVKWPELKAAVEFMYKGEINVSQEQIGPLLRVAEMLKIRGLADVNGDTDLSTAQPSAPSNTASTLPEVTPLKKQRLSARSEWDINHLDLTPNTTATLSAMSATGSSSRHHRKRRWPSASSVGSPVRTSTPDHADAPSPAPLNSSSGVSHPPTTSTPLPPFPIPPQLEAMALSSLGMAHPDDMEIKPGIAEMIREEERVSASI